MYMELRRLTNPPNALQAANINVPEKKPWLHWVARWMNWSWFNDVHTYCGLQTVASKPQTCGNYTYYRIE